MYVIVLKLKFDVFFFCVYVDLFDFICTVCYWTPQNLEHDIIYKACVPIVGTCSSKRPIQAKNT